MIPRPSARVLLVDPSGATLLFRARDPRRPSDGAWWFTPGGAVEEGESLTEAAIREVWEETGLTITPGPVVLIRETVFEWQGVVYDSHETTFVAMLPERPEIGAIALDDIEAEAIVEARWARPEELRGLAEVVYPRCLPELLEQLTTVGPPAVPWREWDRTRR